MLNTKPSTTIAPRAPQSFTRLLWLGLSCLLVVILPISIQAQEQQVEINANSAEASETSQGQADQSQSSQGETGQAPGDASLLDSVVDLKKEILKLNRDLFILEEDLLFPANTQTAVFLSLDGSDLFQLDGAKIAIDQKPVGHHLYTEKELAALQRGAIQRLYTGNIANGTHELVIVLTGTGPKGREYKRAAKLEFEKTTGPQYIQLKIEANTENLQPEFNFKVWQ